MSLGGGGRRPPAVLFALIGAVVTAALAVGTFHELDDYHALRDRGAETSAQVVAVDEGRTHRASVEFQTSDGRRVRAMIEQGDEPADLQLGDEIRIVYDPQEPESDVRDARLGAGPRPVHGLLGLTLLAGAVMVVGTTTIVRHERRDRAARAEVRERTGRGSEADSATRDPEPRMEL